MLFDLYGCYKLYSCSTDEVIFTNTDLSSWVGQSITLVEAPGCWYVSNLTEGLCNNPVTVTKGEPLCTCTSSCYSIGGEGFITYVDTEYNLHTVSAPARVCSVIYPQVTGDNYIIIESGDCVEDGDTFSCPDICYTLTNCDTGETLTSNSDSFLNPYILGLTIKIVGHTGCWTVTSAEDCTCAIALTLQLSYIDCETCKGVTAYKLTNCSNPNDIIYSEQTELEQYAGKTVKIDCGIEQEFCWNVTKINYLPPSPYTTVTIIDSFDNCTDCNTQYYLLTDCEDIADPIITKTDLSAYLNSVVKLPYCPTCWQVSETDQHVNAVFVNIASSFTNCVTCGVIETCTCTKLTNYATGTRTYTYIDCEGVTQNFSLEPNETKKKFCVGRWITRYPTTDNLEEFGDCIDHENTKICPPDPTGRMVKPGYKAPSCDSEQYEKITCKSSEILYKQVLEKRYGISNCCPEEDDKWLIKKELIDLAALKDPDYECTPINSCCSPAPCECSSCNS